MSEMQAIKPLETVVNALKARALQLRIDSIRSTTEAKSGHPTSCLSSADIVSALFFSEFSLDLENPTDLSNDSFILSKGHAAPLLYSVYKQFGQVSDEQLLSLRKFDSDLEGHPTPRFKYGNIVATGSLGQGLSIGVGRALALKLSKVIQPKVWVLMGDGEIAEGSVWEACEMASHYKLDNLVAIIDVNRLGQSGPTLNEHNIFDISEKFASFGWCPIVIDGLDMKQVLCGLCKARRGEICGEPSPTVIIARTVKGAPISEVMDKNGFHGKPFPKDNLPNLIHELQSRSIEASAITLAPFFKPPKPHIRIPLPKHDKVQIPSQPPIQTNKQMNSLRKMYAEGVLEVAKASPLVIGIDGDVKNSTFFEVLGNVNGESRLIEGYIAEQNMIGMTIGLSSYGRIVFVSTFGCFFTRAFDQLRMAAISGSVFHCSGTHVGISTGEDGPSQMGLEDIALFRSLPNSIVLSPCDGFSSYKMAELSANYTQGISYVRLPRSDFPTIYSDNPNEQFQIGGLKILRGGEANQSNRCCVIATGVTVHEAISAADKLQMDDHISICVIDLYSIKPFDSITLHEKAASCGNVFVVVEDHYKSGGIGETISIESSSWLNPPRIIHLCVNEIIPKSGSPEELRSFAKIDKSAIISIIRNLPTTSIEH